MTQEEKQLLLKDLCARLPYGVKVKCGSEILTLNVNWLQTFQYHLDEIKPYLRPMSSMTEEEKDEIAFIRDKDFQSVRKWIRDESIKETGTPCPVTCGEVDFCNKNHFDYRGLIPMGLALEAEEGMYKTE